MFFSKRPEFVSWRLLSNLEQPPRVNIPSLDDLYIEAVLEGSYKPLCFSQQTKWLPAAKILLKRESHRTLYDWASDPELNVASEPDPTPPNGGERASSTTPPTPTDSDVSGSIYLSFIADAA